MNACRSSDSSYFNIFIIKPSDYIVLTYVLQIFYSDRNHVFIRANNDCSEKNKDLSLQNIILTSVFLRNVDTFQGNQCMLAQQREILQNTVLSKVPYNTKIDYTFTFIIVSPLLRVWKKIL